MSIMERLSFGIAAGDDRTESFNLGAYAISTLQPRGKVAVIEVISLPDNWTPCNIRFAISDTAFLADWRGEVVTATQPGDVLVGPPAVWAGVRLFAIVCSVLQAEDVEITVSVGGVDNPAIDHLGALAVQFNGALAQLAAAQQSAQVPVASYQQQMRRTF